MTTIFETKKQYLQFRKAWANAVNSPRAKHWRTPGTIWVVDDPKREWIGHYEVCGWQRHDGWINAPHIVLYNIIRGKPVTNGFTPISNSIKVNNNRYTMYTCWRATVELQTHVEHAQRLVRIIQQIKEGKLHIVSDYKGRPPIKEKDSVIEQSRIDALHRDLNEFLQPFGETFTYRHLANIQVPDYRIDGTYGVKTS
jgi:hypothetical protein